VANDKQEYWAALQDPSAFGAALKQWIEQNAKSSVVQTVREEQRNAYLQLHPINLSGQASASRLMSTGQEGELTVLRVPKAQKYADAVTNVITSQKTTWQCQAGKSDAESRAQTALGNQALEYYWHDKGGEAFMQDLVAQGVPFGETFGFIEFDPSAGEVAMVAPDESGNLNKPTYEGDIRFNIVSSWDAVRDAKANSWEECDKVALCLRRNKHDLAARLGKDVLEACSETKRGILPIEDSSAPSDLIDCWYFFHKKTPSVPLGRQAVLIGDKVFALDQLRYRRVPVVRYFTGKLTGTPFPCAPFWSALAAQELQDSLWSAIATNNLALGTQMVAITAGSEVEPESVGPMRLITVPVGGMEPKPVQLTQSAPESFKLIQMADDAEKQVLGLNNAVLGQPDHAGQSGASQVFLSSMAMQANSSPQATYVKVLKEVGSIVFEIFQDFFKEEHKIQVGGKAMGYMAKPQTFSASSFDKVNSVSVRVGNPLSQTVPGREALFDKYMTIQRDSGGSLQLLKTPEDVQQLLDTGRLEGLTDPLRDSAIRVEIENEALARGEPVTALLGDDDMYHCKHHRSVYISNETREDDALLSNVLEHVWQHYENYFGVPADPADPMYRTNMQLLFGLQPPAPPPMPPPGMPGDPAAAMPPDPVPEVPGMPSMPTNPATGEEFDPEQGA
jgi:hypothetical protein